MEDIYQDLPGIYFVSNGDGYILDANKEFLVVLGYDRGDLDGQKLESFLTLATRIFFQTHFFPLLQLHGHAEEIYITLRTRNGDDIPVLINARRKANEDAVRFYFSGIIIKQRKKYEDEIIAGKKAAEKALNENTLLRAAQAELQKRAEELDRQITIANTHNQELSQINHLATHSLQEPVRKLLFFSNRLMESNEAKERALAIEKIKSAGEDMEAKLRGLQQFVVLTSRGSNCAVLQLPTLIKKAKLNIEQKNPGIEINLNVEEVPEIEANEEEIVIVFEELFSNAVRFRKPGKDVTVKIQAHTLLLNQFRQLPEKYKYAEYVKLHFADDGVGFDDKYQDQAFELFRKLHPMSGRGIGLTLCKKIVENHGGSIVLQSKPGTGTAVILFLPLKQITNIQDKNQ